MKSGECGINTDEYSLRPYYCPRLTIPLKTSSMRILITNGDQVRCFLSGQNVSNLEHILNGRHFEQTLNRF